MATINGVEVAGDKTAHDFRLLDDSDKTEIDNGIERNRKATEDNHEDIVLHRTDRDVHVTPEWKNSLVTKEILGLYWTAAQTADIINEISIAGGAKLVKVATLPETGLEQTIYLVPKTDPQAGDVFDEFVWVDGKYEFIGTTKANLSNYYTKVETDYLFSQLDIKYVKSDDTTLVKLTNLNEINLQEDHYNAWFGYRGGKVTNWKFGDGTEGGYAYVYAKDFYLNDEKLSDLLEAKANDADVVKYTDYATSTKGGVIKFSTSHGIVMSADGFLMGSTRTAEQYASNSGNMLINKGTLENVFASKGFATDADVVHKSGNETISGDKTFTYSVKLKSNTIDNTVTPTTNLFKNLYVTDKNDIALSSLYYAQRTNNNREFNLQVSHPDSNDVLNLNLVHNGSRRSVVFQGDDFVSNLINSNLGTFTNKWKTINGINPGALSLPNVNENVLTVDTTTFQWGANWTYTPAFDGWISVWVPASSATKRRYSASQEYLRFWYPNQNGEVFRFSFPVVKGVPIGFGFISDIEEPAAPNIYLLKALGNV